MLFKDIVDFHGISKRLQKLLRSWIKQARRGTLNPSHVPYSCVIEESEVSCGNPTRKRLRLKLSSRDDSTDSETTIQSTEEYGETSTCADNTSLSESVSVCPSEDSILSPPQNDDVLDNVMRYSTHFSKFGFSEVAPGELPMEEPEEPETGECPKTPLTEFQWKFDRQMSINPQEESILKRILNQPEFANITDDNDGQYLMVLNKLLVLHTLSHGTQ